jgi:hypothetical protein
MSEDVYRAALLVSAPLGRRHYIVHSRQGGTTFCLPGEVASLLLSCQSFKPIQQHARDRFVEWLAYERRRVGGWRAAVSALRYAATAFLFRGSNSALDLPINPFLAEETLAALAHRGLLVGRQVLHEKLLASASGATSFSARLDTVAIPTSGRPAALDRCVSSWTVNQREFGRNGRIAIFVDGDAPPDHSTTNFALADDQVRVVGPSQKRAFARRLAESLGHGLDVVHFALFGSPNVGVTTGANRNAILLATAGASFLSVDDDTLCRPGRPRFAAVDGGCHLSSRFDPRTYRFYPRRELAIEDSATDLVDVARAHEALLGRGIHEICRRYEPTSLNLDDADDALLFDTFTGQGRVVLVSPGVAGHSGIRWPQRVLPMDPDWRRELLASEELYRSATSSQSVVAAAPTLVLSNHSYVNSMFFAVDNTDLLPPFMPNLRSQDVLFGALLRMCRPDSYVAHLPWTLAHDPPEAPLSPIDAVVGHTGVELAYVIADLLSQSQLSGGSAASRMRTLGRLLVQLGSGPLPELVHRVRRSYVSRQASRMAYLEEQLRTHRGQPDYWARDARTHLARLRAALVEPEASLPHDLQRHGSQGWAAMQKLLLSFGQLLDIWPSIVEASRDLARRGEGPLPPPE